ncbi:MAG: FkbM family methyltransferase [Chloroflexi bacterium]|nr:FkbM family methyltransferase [Chloroflexota bacterium]
MLFKLKQIIKSGIRKLLASQGYFIVKQTPGTMGGAFRAIAKRKHLFNTVIDVGASNGSWTDSLMKYFPQCQYLLIEAQPVHAKELNQFSNEHKNVQIVLAAAGETSGQIYFDATNPLGGQASYTPYASNNIQVPATTIDNEIQVRKLVGPYLLKLDTHGFEVPILKGASRTLAETDVIVIECYNFRIAPECMLFFEMCDYLEGFGFRCIDLVDPLYRPYDDSFWQMDLVFVKDNRPEFSYLSYQ